MITSRYISDILELLLDGDENGQAAKLQLSFLTDINYNYTGSGVYVTFSHSHEIFAYRITDDQLVLAGVKIESPELEVGADATLFFTNGIIDYLEVWSFNGNYPKYDLTSYTIIQEWENSLGRIIRVD